MERNVPLEHRLLFAALAFDDGARFVALRKSIQGGPEDPWPRFRHLAKNEQVLASVYALLSRRDLLGRIPPHEVAQLRRYHQYAVLRNERIRAQAEEVAAVLNAAGIEPILLKGGVTLFDTLYEDPGMREMADLDVLVPPADFEKAESALRAVGFEETAGFEREKTFQAPPMSRPNDLATVEIHRLVGEQRAVLPVASVVSQSVPIESARAALRKPAPVHRIVQNLFHSEIQDRGHRLRLVRVRQLVEFARLCGRYAQEINVRSLSDHLRAHGLYEVFVDRLALARELLAMPVPWGLSIGRRRHVGACMRRLRWPALAALERGWAGATAPFKPHHMDLLYGCGTSGTTLAWARLGHFMRLAARHRMGVFGKAARAREMYR